MKNYIMEVPSLKITGFTIKGETGRPLILTLRVMGINRIHDSAINTMASFGNVTYLETANRVRFSQGVFRMNAASGASLQWATGYSRVRSNFPFSAGSRENIRGDISLRSAGNTQDLIDEPTNDGPPGVSLKLTFPRHTGSTYLAILGGDVRQKMDITFTGLHWGRIRPNVGPSVSHTCSS